MDECLAGHAANEGIDDVGVSDVGELVALLREALDVLPEGLIGPLPAVVEVPRVTGSSVCWYLLTCHLFKWPPNVVNISSHHFY